MSAQDVFVIVHCASPPYFVEGGDFRDFVKLVWWRILVLEMGDGETTDN
jgi:hypothetical protein